MKTCSDCGESRPLADFYPKRRPSGGYTSYCRPCNRERVRRWRQENPEKHAANQARHAERRRGQRKARPATPEESHRTVCARRGLTPEEYAAMLAAQGGTCAICDSPPGSRRLAIDHDHATGVVRGLLCPRCNTGLAYFRDRPELFRTAADYLERTAA